MATAHKELWAGQKRLVGLGDFGGGGEPGRDRLSLLRYRGRSTRSTGHAQGMAALDAALSAGIGSRRWLWLRSYWWSL
ncbi:hypothetical protein PT974_06796 [Cladobotryum mycophilum]|uniref:Uncharacterized protein n=1 Tax=Cladobotryum mycophilum TaxID=491253 RepID=A0ABR0SNP8_9HYPO